MKKKIRKILLRDKNIQQETYFWNSFSAALNSFQTMLLLFVITRVGNMTDSSILVMAYAVGNLLYNIGKYGVRQFQVTDTREHFGFYDYIVARYISMVFMLISVLIYLAGGIFFKNYSFEKTAVIFLICVYKGIEAYEDVLHGRMQQKGAFRFCQ